MSEAAFNSSLNRDWRLSKSDIDLLVSGRHGDPFAVLGPHEFESGRWRVCVFAPHADAVEVIDAEGGGSLSDLEQVDEAGVFAGSVALREPKYRLRMRRGEHTWDTDDPYRFGSSLGELDVHLMAEGTHRRNYEKLGAHLATVDGVAGVSFAVWAPNAVRVSVIGDFNSWDGRRHPMRKRHEAGVWDLFVPGIGRGSFYKFEIVGRDGNLLPLKADPIAFSQEAAPATASIVTGPMAHDWHDDEWMRQRAERQSTQSPISIYEVHLGSWRRGTDGSFLDYDRLAEELLGYVRDLGFTHIELLPISEHPFTGSWGYQPIGLFAPTSRFGTPEGFARFVDAFHSAGIGVLIDWVPAHFPSDPHGLIRFDGTALYEHEDPRLGIHKDWDTLIYNFGRREVSNFLASNAAYWLSRYHIDGLRVDAVASMLYLDYSRKEGEWVPNKYGGRENLEAIEFLKRVNGDVKAAAPGAITVAEESTAFPGVSHPVEQGGLGFAYKWNMGWMHDTLEYMSKDPIHRRYHHNELTFSLHYAFSENFVLPLSHDEVVHGKGSLLNKMPGDRWQKFANLRAYLSYMWTHPGKKLLFMGGEFAQEREWNHDHSLDWHLLAQPEHRAMQSLVRDLNRLYRELPALHARDCSPEGFAWINGGDTANSVIAFQRLASGSPPVVVVCNFTPLVRHGYRIGVPHGGHWRERFNSDSTNYGGSNVGNCGGVTATETPMHGLPASIEITLPPLATMMFTPADA